jgi:AGCS family alanine or glycine:cation symporter
MEFINQLNSFTKMIADHLWSLPLAAILLGVGFIMTILLKFVQIRGFKHGIELISGKYDRPEHAGAITHFQALTAALSATIGTGNIAGVAIGIYYGGPGAVFWMWVTAVFGMALKFSSCTLAQKYRKIDKDGYVRGGPMYYIEQGLGKNFKFLAVAFAIFTAVAAFGIGNMAQANSVANAFSGLVYGSHTAKLDSTAVTSDSLSLTAAANEYGINDSMPVSSESLSPMPPEDDSISPDSLAAAGKKFVIDKKFWFKLIFGIVLAFIVGLVIIGGIKRIGQVASKIVPFMSIFYVCGALYIIFTNLELLGHAFNLIFTSAFNPKAAQGGVLGSGFFIALRWGVSKGIFSNESGLGTAPMAHAAAKTDKPVREGLVAMLGPFIDTIIICTMTALVIILAGNWTSIEGAELTSNSFEHFLPGVGHIIVSIGLIFFAFSTLVTWSYYGEKGFEYLFGRKRNIIYRWIFLVFIPLGAAIKIQLVWSLSDIGNALMAAPNLIAILLLSPILVKMTREYFIEHKASKKK